MKHLLSLALAASMLLCLILPGAMAEMVIVGQEDMAAYDPLVITDVTQDPETRELHIEFESAMAEADRAENYTVTLGGNLLTIKGVTLVEGETPAAEEASSPAVQQDTRTTWIFLTDVSSIATNHGQEPVRSMLRSLASMVGYFDNGAFVTTQSPIPSALTNGEALESQATAAYSESASNLYTAVNNVLDYLSTNQAGMNPNRCLVILSKGDDRTVADTYMQSTVLQKIAASDVAVYTVAFTDAPSANFEAMAQKSQDSGHGGLAIDFNNGGTNLDTGAIWLIRNAEADRLNGGEAIQRARYAMDTSAPEERGTGDTVHISFSAAGMETGADYTPENPFVYAEKNFFARLIDGIKRGEMTSVAIAAAAAVLLVLIVVLLIRLPGGKKRADANINQGEVVPPPTDVVSGVDNGGSTVVETQTAKRLQLTLKEQNGKVHRAMMTPAGVTGGRQGDNHIVLDSNDKQVSRHHFIIHQQGEQVMLEGISETNGTYVNGMRITGPVALRQRDVVRVGKSELTVTWKYE